MLRFGKIAALILIAGLFYVSPAHAQATRTWVSGVGDDVNPCSRTAPCKTFAGAISKTAAGGEINCLDPGGFGAVTITKSMTIDCHYTEGGALAGGNGVVVNLPAATDVVFLRGLDIFGVNPPTNGVRFISQGTLHIEDCVIRRFNAANSLGVSFAPTAPSELYITDSTIAENGNGATGGGIEIKPTGASGSARAVLTNVRLLNNANHGIRVDSASTTTAIPGNIVSIESSNISGNTNGIIINAQPGTPTSAVMLINSNVSMNSSIGILASGGQAAIRVGNTTVTGNGVGLSFVLSAFGLTYGNNRVVGNTSSDGVFTAVPIGTQ
jgi:hypothetical protein